MTSLCDWNTLAGDNCLTLFVLIWCYNLCAIATVPSSCKWFVWSMWCQWFWRYRPIGIQHHCQRLLCTNFFSGLDQLCDINLCYASCGWEAGRSMGNSKWYILGDDMWTIRRNFFIRCHRPHSLENCWHGGKYRGQSTGQATKQDGGCTKEEQGANWWYTVSSSWR